MGLWLNRGAVNYTKIELRKRLSVWNDGRWKKWMDVIPKLAEREVLVFSTRNMRKTSMAKMYETKRFIIARFSVRIFDYELKKIYREWKLS